MPAGQTDRARSPRRGRPGFLRAILGELDRDWMNRALCRLVPLSDVDEIFFPINGRSHDDKRRYARRVAKAKRICGACPVKNECEDYRRSIGDDNGVWGGRDELERQSEERPLTSTNYRKTRHDC